MVSFSLKIADYIIRFETTPGAPDLLASEKFKSFICNDPEPDLIIRVHSGKYISGTRMTRVFHAPYVEEVNEVPVRKKDDFWSIYSDKNNLIIRILYPTGKPGKESWLRFSLSDPEWDLFIETEEEQIDPFEYPLDGLVLYYLTVIRGDIFIHGSGVNYNHKGYLFTGTSGQGKTTLARLWEDSGARVIHDDRLIIRNIQGKYIMYNTPVYDNDTPAQSPLDRIFIISHGSKNEQQLIHGANALTGIMANCIQHNWSPEIISKLTASLYHMNNMLMTYKLYFKPDNSIVGYILSNE
jgi:hypothetical protein